MIKAIETHYNGYRFRSRLEARWAVFFNALGIEYQYEPEGFEFEDGTRYLPDFRIPSSTENIYSWIEIKSGLPNRIEIKKASTLAKITESPCMIFYTSFDHQFHLGLFFAQKSGLCAPGRVTFGICPLCNKFTLPLLVYTENKYGMSLFCDCIPFDLNWSADSREYLEWYDRAYIAEKDKILSIIYAREIIDARNSARSARFEHGESP